MRSTGRVPRLDAAWAERRALHDRARLRAARDPAVRLAVLELRALLDAGERPADEFRDTFQEASVKAALAVCLAEPVLLELAAPLPTGMPLLAREIALAVVDHRLEVSPNDARAGAMREELVRVPDVAPRAALLFRSHRLWALTGEKRGRGQPPGPAGKVRGLNAAEVETRVVRELVDYLARRQRMPSTAAIAERFDLGKSAFETALQHHGLVWVELKTLAKGDRSARGRRFPE